MSQCCTQDDVKKLQKAIGKTSRLAMTVIAATVDANEYLSQRLRNYMNGLSGAIQFGGRIEQYQSQLVVEVEEVKKGDIVLLEKILKDLPLLRANLRMSTMTPFEKLFLDKATLVAGKVKSDPYKYAAYVQDVANLMHSAYTSFLAVLDLASLEKELLEALGKNNNKISLAKFQGACKKVRSLKERGESGDAMWKALQTFSQCPPPSLQEAEVEGNQSIMVGTLAAIMDVFKQKLVAGDVGESIEAVLWGAASNVEKTSIGIQSGTLTSLIESGLALKKVEQSRLGVSCLAELDCSTLKQERVAILNFKASLEASEKHIQPDCYKDLVKMCETATESFKGVAFGLQGLVGEEVEGVHHLS